jgi:hypothetical protein
MPMQDFPVPCSDKWSMTLNNYGWNTSREHLNTMNTGTPMLVVSNKVHVVLHHLITIKELKPGETGEFNGEV